MTLNPTSQVDKANDARRKKDLAKIKVAFEEYYNDKGCYPSGELLENLNNDSSCGTGVFSPWIEEWPCDPTMKTAYYVFTQEVGCPGWFKLITNLSNQNDRDIPMGWYTLDIYQDSFIGDGSLSTEKANYGTSSTNKIWYEITLSDKCESKGRCYQLSSTNACQLTKAPHDRCQDSNNCYVDRQCLPECKVSECCDGGLCN
jgi:hypothetical protein